MATWTTLIGGKVVSLNLKSTDCRPVSHAEARAMHRDGRYQALTMSVLRLAVRIAVGHSRAYKRNKRPVYDDIIGPTLLEAVVLPRRWKPRKATWRRYVTRRLRRAAWDAASGRTYRKRRDNIRPRGLSGDFAHNRRVVSLGNGCLAEMEEVLYDVLGMDDAQLLARKYGLLGYEIHPEQELMEHFGITKNQMNWRLSKSMRKLHNHFCPDDPLTVKEFVAHRRRTMAAWRKSAGRPRAK